MKTLNLKSVKRAGTSPPTTSTTVVAGRKREPQVIKVSEVVLSNLQAVIQNCHQLFLQMRHGVSYCGIPEAIEDGWLTLNQVTIHGKKQTVEVKRILIQIGNGSLIAHLHAVTP